MIPLLRPMQTRGVWWPFANPDRDALDADVIWLPEISDTVLAITAISYQKSTPSPMFALAELRCRHFIIQEGNRIHALFRHEAARLQLLIEGASLHKPVCLLIDAIIEPRRFEARAQLLRRLGALAAHGILMPNLHQSFPRGRRLAFVLQALDGHLAGASHRDIAVTLLGSRRVADAWADPRRNLSDQVRRAVSRGRFLMKRGYLDLVK